MHKHKPHKGLLKRIKITGTGKVKFKGANTGHLKSGKSGNRLRHLNQPKYAKKSDVQRFERMLNRRLTAIDSGPAQTQAQAQA